MSYFSIEPRVLFSSCKTSCEIGPGFYQDEGQKVRCSMQSYAPFGSLCKKKREKLQDSNLGPGEYQIGGQICKPSITKYQNPNSIIIKINEEGWSQFKSKTNRFQPSLCDRDEIPGPGRYSPERIPERKRSKSQNKIYSKNFIGQKIKQINLKNYIQRRKPTLFSDPIQFKMQQTPKNPKCKGLSWSLNKKQRFQPFEKQIFYEQHKQQIIEQIKNQKKYQKAKSQSAAFASNSLKSHFQAKIYQTNNPFKVQLRKMIQYKDDRPGPGSYDYHEHEINEQFRFYKHQFFGSTQQRFKTSASLGSKIGPGYYSPEKFGEKKQKNVENTQAYEGQQVSNTGALEQGYSPGPGSYSLDKVRQHKESCKWVFKSKRPRFLSQSALEQNQQVLDEYQILRKIRKQKQFEYRKELLNSGKQANFASTTNRFQQIKRETPNIPIGCYDTTHTDIATKIKKFLVSQKETQRINRNFVPVPFMSAVNRFKPQEEQKATHHDCWCLVKIVEKQVYHHQSPAFTSKQKRTLVFDNKNQGYAPAVGTYNQQSSIVKNSFNSRFLKASEKISKKLKFWENQKKKIEKKAFTASARQKQICMIKVN